MLKTKSIFLRKSLIGALVSAAVAASSHNASAEPSNDADHWVVTGQNQAQPEYLTQIFGQFTLWVNQSIQVGQMLLVMQGDGNLVLYHMGLQRAVWYSGTGADCSHGNCYATFQGDGNLVVYSAGQAVWNTATWASGIDAIMISEQFPFFGIRSSYAGFWGVVPNGTLIHPYTNTVMPGTMSFR